MILKPKGFDPKKSYAMIEYIYSGPNANVVSNSLPNPALRFQEVANNRDFIIVFTDGRGTQMRGLAFQNMPPDVSDKLKFPTTRQPTRKRAQLHGSFTSRNFGLSWGGYFALRALIQEPE